MPEGTKHIVMYSGGACSWATAMRVKQRHLGEDIVLLFADTKMEDQDLYRFLNDSSKQLVIPIIRIADGRTPWGVFEDQNIIGNSRMAPCSQELKRKILDNWLKNNCYPGSTVIHFGIDWTEFHRLERLRKTKPKWTCEAYMTEPPYLSKADMLSWMKREGLQPPRLYALGFHHNNCGGFCVKAGQAQFALLLKTMPERYAFHEQRERELRSRIGDYGILSDRSGGKRRQISLEEFRKRVEAKETYDEFDFGGCGCALD